MLRGMSLGIEVYTATHKDTDFKDYCEAIDRFHLHLEKHGTNDKLIENYRPKRLQSRDSIGITVYLDDGALLGFSTVITRDIFGNGTRVLNRFVKSPVYRFENERRRVSQETKDMIQQQLNISRELGFDYSFMSRYTTTTRSNFDHYGKQLTFAEWKNEPGRYCVTENFHHKTSYQHLIWTSFNDNVKELPMYWISDGEFNELEEL